MSTVISVNAEISINTDVNIPTYEIKYLPNPASVNKTIVDAYIKEKEEQERRNINLSINEYVNFILKRIDDAAREGREAFNITWVNYNEDKETPSSYIPDKYREPIEKILKNILIPMGYKISEYDYSKGWQYKSGKIGLFTIHW